MFLNQLFQCKSQTFFANTSLKSSLLLPYFLSANLLIKLYHTAFFAYSVFWFPYNSHINFLLFSHSIRRDTHYLPVWSLYTLHDLNILSNHFVILNRRISTSPQQSIPNLVLFPPSLSFRLSPPLLSPFTSSHSSHLLFQLHCFTISYISLFAPIHKL